MGHNGRPKFVKTPKRHKVGGGFKCVVSLGVLKVVTETARRYCFLCKTGACKGTITERDCKTCKRRPYVAAAGDALKKFEERAKRQFDNRELRRGADGRKEKGFDGFDASDDPTDYSEAGDGTVEWSPRQETRREVRDPGAVDAGRGLQQADVREEPPRNDGNHNAFCSALRHAIRFVGVRRKV